MVWNIFYFPIYWYILGISSSQLTFIFFSGVQTTNQYSALWKNPIKPWGFSTGGVCCRIFTEVLENHCAVSGDPDQIGRVCSIHVCYSCYTTLHLCDFDPYSSLHLCDFDPFIVYIVPLYGGGVVSTTETLTFLPWEGIMHPRWTKQLAKYRGMRHI